MTRRDAFLAAAASCFLPRAARAAITDIVWVSGKEYIVANAPPGFEALHFGPRFSCTTAVPDGDYAVTLAFIEPTMQGAEDAARVFDVLINDQPVLVGLDVFARAGYMKPLYRVALVSIRGGTLVVDFRATVRSAICSGIVVEPLQGRVLKVG